MEFVFSLLNLHKTYLAPCTEINWAESFIHQFVHAIGFSNWSSFYSKNVVKSIEWKKIWNFDSTVFHYRKYLSPSLRYFVVKELNSKYIDELLTDRYLLAP